MYVITTTLPSTIPNQNYLFLRMILYLPKYLHTEVLCTLHQKMKQYQLQRGPLHTRPQNQFHCTGQKDAQDSLKQTEVGDVAENGAREKRPPLDLEVLEHIEDNPRVQQEVEENAFTLTIDLAFN